MARLDETLRGLHPTITKIMAISGTAATSAGVIHQGEVVHEAHFGFRDHARSLKPDSDTLYGIGSMTKAMVAFAIGDLVERQIMTWNDKLRDIIPEFTSPDAFMAGACTITDILSHRSGLPTFNILWYQGNALPLIPKSALLPMVSVMKPSFSLRCGWRYSNWGYALAGEAIARRTGAPFEQQLRKCLFDPLGMSRTTLSPGWREDGNAAEGFIGLSDSSLIPILSQVVDQTTVMAPAGGVCSTTKELLIYYSALLQALARQFQGGGKPLSGSPFKQLAKIFAGHTSLPLRLSTIDEYALGWFKGYLPGLPGILTENNSLVPEMPVIGEGAAPQVIFSHNGSLAGFTSTVFLLPTTQTCVFVLTNTKSACDSSNLIAKAILQIALGSPAEIDFVQLAETAMEASATRYETRAAELDAARVKGTQSTSIEAYTGRYYWDTDAYFADIALYDGALSLKFQDRDDQVYPLEHYHYDTFTWLMTDEEEARRSRYVQAAGAYKFVFERNELGGIDRFTWQEMGGGPGIFRKRGLN